MTTKTSALDPIDLYSLMVVEDGRIRRAMVWERILYLIHIRTAASDGLSATGAQLAAAACCCDHSARAAIRMLIESGYVAYVGNGSKRYRHYETTSHGEALLSEFRFSFLNVEA